MWTGKDWAILLHLPTACTRSAEVCAPMLELNDREVDYNFYQYLGEDLILSSGQ